MDFSTVYTKQAVSSSAKGGALSAKRNHRPKLFPLYVKGRTRSYLELMLELSAARLVFNWTVQVLEVKHTHKCLQD